MTKSRMKPLSEQVIVLTEAAYGLGLSLARFASERGARLVVCSGRDDEVRALTEDIRQKGGSISFLVGDITLPETHAKIKDLALRDYGRIDTWINCAGESFSGYILDSDPNQERKQFDRNFWATRLGSQVAARALKEFGGTIINLGSEVAVTVQPLFGVYAGAREAVRTFTDALRSELRAQNFPVEVVLVRPGSLQYSFDAAAEAILKCAEDPERDVTVGGPAKLTAILDTFFPRVKDMVTETRLKDLRKLKLKSPDEIHPEDQNTISIFKTITQSARKSIENFRRPGP